MFGDECIYYVYIPIDIALNTSNKGCGMCYPFHGMMHIKDLLLLISRVAHLLASCFLSHYLNGSLPYVRCHITVNKMS